jgi:hypothetical protein
VSAEKGEAADEKRAGAVADGVDKEGRGALQRADKPLER